MGIQEQALRVKNEVADYCRSVGRDPRDVRLIAVSKTVGIEEVRQAASAGLEDFGENRPDQIVMKAAALPDMRWHFIGNIQSRRIPDIVQSSVLIHSVCKVEHVEKIARAAANIGKVQDILLEVNVSHEQSKSGFSPDDMQEVVQTCAAVGQVRLRGLMTMAPQGDLACAGKCFEALCALESDLRNLLEDDQAACFNELSMGMSEDWRQAVCSGATMVRIGRAIFSESFSEG